MSLFKIVLLLMYFSRMLESGYFILAYLVFPVQSLMLHLKLGLQLLVCESHQMDTNSASSQTEARETIPRMLVELDLGRTEKCVRVNSVSSGLAEADLQVILQAEVLPPAIMLPKVENIQEVKWVSNHIVLVVWWREPVQGYYIFFRCNHF